MNRQFLKDAVGWGFLLWLIGYVLGFVFFAFVPTTLIGRVITPIGVVITIWVLLKKIRGNSLKYYLSVGIAWTAIAIVCDYLFLVLLLKLVGYYKLDVYLYYALTLALPVLVGWWKLRKQTSREAYNGSAYNGSMLETNTKAPDFSLKDIYAPKQPGVEG